MKKGTMDPRSMTKNHAAHKSHTAAAAGHYNRFAVMVLLSFITMYVLMYAMADSFSSVYSNINQVYMAGLMAAPMAILEVVLMRSMYTDFKLNLAILVLSLGALIFFWFGIRNQIGVNDAQFARSMIPHHSGAILMCNEANLTDPELKILCANIVKGQREEVDQLKNILERLE